MNYFKLIFATFFLGFTFGCETMGRLFKDPDQNPPARMYKTPLADANQPEAISETEIETYSKNTQMIPAVDRNYKRMTKERMEEESNLQAGAGSLWVMEGQKSFLFAQNKKRQEGDPTAIKVEGSAMKQVQLKINTIQDLLNELEEQKRQADLDQKKVEMEKKRLADIEIEKQKLLDVETPPEEKVALEQATKIVADRKPAAADIPKTPPPVKEAKVDLKEIEMIPSKIVEKTDSGMYRVSGFQTLTIKNRPYKVIATGLIRSDDFNDQQVSSVKLVDPQFEVLHMRIDAKNEVQKSESAEGVTQ